MIEPPPLIGTKPIAGSTNLPLIHGKKRTTASCKTDVAPEARLLKITYGQDTVEVKIGEGARR